jgi:hypothetical protein
MKAVMHESKFGAPVGTYQCQFLGVEELPQTRPGPNFGPAWRWQWRILMGEHMGKIISRTTSQEPTTKNACGKMLQAVTGRAIAVNEEVDLTAYVGRQFAVQVEPDSTGKGTRVGMVMPQSAPAANGAPAAPTPPPSPQPAAQVAAQQPAATPPQPPAASVAAPQGRKFWYMPCVGEKPELGTDTDVQTFIAANGLDPAKTMVMLLGEHHWRPASEFGFTAKQPF